MTRNLIDLALSAAWYLTITGLATIAAITFIRWMS